MRKIRFRRSAVSQGVVLLKEELERRGHNAKLIALSNSKYRQSPDDLVINWGCAGADGLNRDAQIATDKRLTFNILADNGCIPCPDFTSSAEEARVWLDEGSSVVCRTLTKASSGRGIVIADTPEELVSAPLYTRYIKKREEYRVHVFDGRVIDVQRKARRLETDSVDVNWRVRTADNGFVFVRQEVTLPETVHEMCISTINALGLAFGAVDVIWNEKQNAYYVLEVNTAPGLEGTTVINYADAIERML